MEQKLSVVIIDGPAVANHQRARLQIIVQGHYGWAQRCHGVGGRNAASASGVVDCMWSETAKLQRSTANHAVESQVGAGRTANRECASAIDRERAAIG